eukprot:2388075-Amphidinium_carterae.1
MQFQLETFWGSIDLLFLRIHTHMSIKEGSQGRDRPGILGGIVPRRNGDAMVEARSVTGDLYKLEVGVAKQRALCFRQRADRRGQRTGCIAHNDLLVASVHARGPPDELELDVKVVVPATHRSTRLDNKPPGMISQLMQTRVLRDAFVQQSVGTTTMHWQAQVQTRPGSHF